MDIIKKIEGIGNKEREALEKAGIRSLEERRRMDIETISKATGIEKSTIRQLKAMAELQLIPLIDHQLSEVLVTKGNIHELTQLAQSNPGQIMELITASIKKGFIPEKYKALGADDFQAWINTALELSCYEQLRSDREYLNYLIELSGDTALELEERYHQRFIESEDENSSIKNIRICIEILQADLDEKKKDNPNYEYKSQEKWTEETGDISDYGYLQYLLSIEAQSKDEEKIKKTAHLLSEQFKINFFVDPLEISTRVRQCILTRQAILQEDLIEFSYRNQWVQKLDQADFPENFYQVKKRLIKGDIEFLKKQLSDCNDILSNCYIKYNSTTSKFSEDPLYSHIYQDMTKAIELIEELIRIDDLIMAGDRYFFHEEFQLAINSYLEGYNQIQKVLPTLARGLRLVPILDTSYPLDDVSAQIDSFFKNLSDATAVMPDETFDFRFEKVEKEPRVFGGGEINSNKGVWKAVDDGFVSYPYETQWYSWSNSVTQREEHAGNANDRDNIKGFPDRRRGAFLYFTEGTDWENYDIRLKFRWSREGNRDFGIMFRFHSPPDGLYYRLSLSRCDNKVYLVKGGRPLNKDRNGEDQNYIRLAEAELICRMPDTGEDLYWDLLLRVNNTEDGARIKATIRPLEFEKRFNGCDEVTEVEFTDPDPIPRGTIAFYSFFMFCRWEDLQVIIHKYLTGEGILKTNPFKVVCPDSAPLCLSLLSSANYEDRTRKNISLQTLQHLVSIHADNFNLVNYGIKESSNDYLNDFEIIYNTGANKVNRFALAQLLNTLPYLIPHYYYYMLPIALGDCHRGMVDLGQAQVLYNLIYKPADTQQLINSFYAVKSDWELETTPIVLKESAAPAYVIAGSKQWSDYRLELEAKKTGGSEGFLIIFRYTDENHWLWWNIGGWDNTQSAIEYDQWGTGVNIIEESITNRPIDKIIRDRWYKIEITVQGYEITCSIDGITMQCRLPLYPLPYPHLAGCIGLGAWNTLVEYRNVRVTQLNEQPIYPYLNPNIEHFLMQMRLAQIFIDWGHSLYRQQDAESIQRAKEMYKKALQVHAALDWCEEDLYGVMEDAIGGLIKAPLPPQVIDEAINTVEDVKYTKDLSKVKETYKEIARIVTSDIAKESMVAELSSLLNRDFTKYWKDIVIAEEPLIGSIERTLVPVTQTNRSMISALAMRASRTQAGYELPKGEIVLFGAPSPICTPENPLILKQKREACLRIYMIDQKLNFLGFRNNYLSIFRYDYLVEQAKAFANMALSVERDFLSFKEKFESESLTNLQAELALALTLATVQLEELRRIEAKDKLALSRMQVNLVYAKINELEKKLEELDWFDYVESVVTNLIPVIGKAKETNKDVAEFATEELGISEGAATVAGWGAVVAYAGLKIYKGISAVEDQKDSLENQIGRLSAHDLPMSKQNMQVSKDQLMIAVRQKDIAIMKVGFSQDILEFLKGKFLNEELWSYLARSIKEIYELYMEYTITLAWLAERSLEFERGSEINRIRFNYFSAERQGLLAAENLIKDIASLEYDKLATEEKKIPIKQVISLAQLFPYQFSSFLKTGITEFYITLEFFDSLYPGLYQARIKNIELQIIGALPLSEPHATLTNLGISRIRTLDHKAEGKKFVEMAIYNRPETIALSGYAIKEDRLMFRPSEEEKVLYPFEGLGVDSYWVLDMGKEANAVDFSQIIDVQLVIYYTAQYDEGLKNSILEELPRFKTHIRPFSLQYKAAEEFAEFINPAETDRARDMRILNFTTTKADFPANQIERRIKNLYIFIKAKNGEINPLTMHVFSAQHPEVVKVTSNERGLIGSNIGADDQDTNPSPLNVFSGLNVEDRWYLKILPEDNVDLLKKNAAGNVVSDPDNGFLQVKGPDSGTGFPNIKWPNDLCITTKVQLNKGLVRFIFRKSVDGEYQVDFSRDGLYLYKNEVIVPEPNYERTLLWEDGIPHLENTWYGIQILVIQDMIKVFVDGLERIRYKDQSNPFMEGAFVLSPINNSSDSYVDMDDFLAQEVDQFGIITGDLFIDHFTEGKIKEEWYIENEYIDKWQVAYEENIVNPTVDLTFIEDILFLMEHEYRLPGPALLHVEPEILDFGKVDTGNSKMLEAQLENTGSSDLLISRFLRFLPQGFRVDLPEGISPENPLRLQPSEHLTVPVTFQPVSTGNIYGSIVIHSNDARSGYDTRVLTLYGQGFSPELSITPEELGFGDVCLGESCLLKLRLSNTGEADLEINDIQLSGRYFSADLPSSLRLKPGRHEEWIIGFAPPIIGERAGILSFKSNDPNKPTMEIPLTGRGIHWLSTKPSMIDFGDVPVNQWTRFKELTLTNIGPSSCEITEIIARPRPEVEFTFIGPSPDQEVPFTIRCRESLTIKVSAKPTGSGTQRGSLGISCSANGILPLVSVDLKVRGI